MTNYYKPAAYTSVAPYLMVDGAERVIRFLQTAFAAEVLRRYARTDGTIMHAEVRVDDTVVMLADSTAGAPAFPAWMHVYVPDVDATYARALAAGGTAVQAPGQKDDPDRRGGVQDPAGNVWWIATQTAPPV